MDLDKLTVTFEHMVDVRVGDDHMTAEVDHEISLQDVVTTIVEQHSESDGRILEVILALDEAMSVCDFSLDLIMQLGNILADEYPSVAASMRAHLEEYKRLAEAGDVPSNSKQPQLAVPVKMVEPAILPVPGKIKEIDGVITSSF